MKSRNKAVANKREFFIANETKIQKTIETLENETKQWTI